MAFEGNIDLYRVYKKYGENQVLQDANLKVSQGEFVVICGHSGSGKTTLLKLLYGEEKADEGEICIEGRDLSRLSRAELQAVRRRMGIVFQKGWLLEDRTVFENLEFVIKAFHFPSWQGRKRAFQVLRLVGMEKRFRCKMRDLSGGEKQRVAVARALINGPSIILADEPTAHLDQPVAVDVMEILELVSQLGPTILVATHNLASVEHLRTKRYELAEGRLKAVRSSHGR